MANELRLTIDEEALDVLTFDDLVTLEGGTDAAGKPLVTLREMRDILNRVVVGGVGQVPAREIRNVFAQVGTAIKAWSDSKN